MKIIKNYLIISLLALLFFGMLAGTASADQPSIISFGPLDLIVNDTVGATREFNITVNQTVNVTWYINGTSVQDNVSVPVDTQVNYTNTSAGFGIWNITATATNENMNTVSQEWTWNVTTPTPTPGAPNITSFAPTSPVNDLVGATREFNIIVNQPVNVTWYINGTSVQDNVSVPADTQVNYTNTSAGFGIWNITATATNENMNTVSQEWTWNVSTTVGSVQAPVDLGTAGNFVILSKSGITNVPTSAITGNIGTSPITGAAITGLGCSEVTGTIYTVDAAGPACRVVAPVLLTAAVSDMEAAYTDAAGRTLPDATELYGGNIGGRTLAPGLYKWSTGVTIPTSVTLSGGANDVWIFQIAGDLSIASKGDVSSGIKVLLAGGAEAKNIFWQVGGGTGATLGTYSTFNGNILSAKQVIIETGAVLNGRAMADSQVTLDANVITAPEALNIISFAPTSPVNDLVGATREFNITVNQPVNVTWYINGTSVQDNVSVPADTQVNYTNTSAGFGIWNITATATNENMNTVSQEWTWNVSTTVGSVRAPVNLGTAGNFAILAKTAITTTGTTSIVGDIGVSPAAATYITGFGLIMDATNTFSRSSLVTGKIYAADYTPPTPAYMTTAISDMEAAYTDAAGRTLPDYTELGAGNIGGLTLTPGLYKWSSGVTIPTNVTLSGNSTDVWIFQIAGTLDISSAKQVILSGGAQAKNIFWQVADVTTLGTYSTFNGNILDMTLIALQTGATLNGRALAQTAVTLDANAVNAPSDTTTPIVITITNPSNGSTNTTGNVNVTVTLDATGLAQYLNWQGQNYTMTPTTLQIPGTVFFRNMTGLLSGNYSFKVYANDSSGISNVSETRTITVNRTTVNTTIGTIINTSTFITNATLEITAPSGNVTVTIPNGTNASVGGVALTSISIDSIAQVNSTFVAIGSNDRFVGENLSVGPEGAIFSPDIQIRFNYTDAMLTAAGVSASTLRVKFYNTTTNTWVVQTPYTLNETGKYITANVSHFSTFALLGTVTTTPSTPSTGGGGGSGGSTGGSGVSTSEPYTNIAKSERYDKSLIANTPVTYTFKVPELGIYEIVVTGKESENDIALRVEALKDTSKLVKEPAQGVVYRNVNVWAGTKRIKEVLIRFKVENSWISNNNLAPNEVKLVKWDGSNWVQLETKDIAKDATYTSYEAKTDTLSVFAIAGLKGVVVPTATPAIEVTATPAISAETPKAPTAIPTEKAPGFELGLAVATLLAVYIFRRKKQ